MNVFDSALERIQAHGWKRGAMRGLNGEYCVVGAIILREETMDDELEFLEHFCKANYGVGFVVHVNDTILKTQDEAESLLEKASIAWEARA